MCACTFIPYVSCDFCTVQVSVLLEHISLKCKLGQHFAMENVVCKTDVFSLTSLSKNRKGWYLERHSIQQFFTPIIRELKANSTIAFPMYAIEIDLLVHI